MRQLIKVAELPKSISRPLTRSKPRWARLDLLSESQDRVGEPQREGDWREQEEDESKESEASSQPNSNNDNDDDKNNGIAVIVYKYVSQND